MLETDRLYLREFRIEDYDDLFEIFSDEEVMKHYQYVLDEKGVKNWINGNIDRYNNFGFGLWAVVLKETGKVIGDCGLSMQIINKKIKPEIGYHFNKKYWRQGFAHEAAKACIEWTFENTPFRMLYSYMTKDNVASYATAMSNGMKKVDEYIDTDKTLTVVYAISKEEWLHKEN